MLSVAKNSVWDKKISYVIIVFPPCQQKYIWYDRKIWGICLFSRNKQNHTSSYYVNTKCFISSAEINGVGLQGHAYSNQKQFKSFSKALFCNTPKLSFYLLMQFVFQKKRCKRCNRSTRSTSHYLLMQLVFQKISRQAFVYKEV